MKYNNNYLFLVSVWYLDEKKKKCPHHLEWTFFFVQHGVVHVLKPNFGLISNVIRHDFSVFGFKTCNPNYNVLKICPAKKKKKRKTKKNFIHIN